MHPRVDFARAESAIGRNSAEGSWLRFNADLLAGAIDTPFVPIAEALGISLPAAKGRLFHAKKALRGSVIGNLAEKEMRMSSKMRKKPGLRPPGEESVILAIGRGK